MTAAGSPPSCAITATLLRSPQTVSCSRAAARKVSPAASSTDRPWPWKYLASLPIDVVLPAPLTPASMMTNGRAAVTTSGSSSGASRSSSAALSSVFGSASPPARFHRAREVVEQVPGGRHADVAR